MSAQVEKKGYEIGQAEIDKVIAAVDAIKDGPRVLQLYMDICAKCGTCAEQCHVSLGDPHKRTNPALRSDRIRRLFKKDMSMVRKVASMLAGMDSRNLLDKDAVEEWVRDFYECSGCRRCAKFCPMGIDNSVITRKGRAILHSLGMTPDKLVTTQVVSDQTGNDEGFSRPAFMDVIGFLEEELEEQHGVPIKIPVGKVGADVLYVGASADFVSSPDTVMGYAAFFHAAGIDWTMSHAACDAANMGLFSGDDPHMKAKNKVLHDAAMRLKVKRLVIGECGHAYRVAKFIGGTNYWGKDIPYEITSIFYLGVDALRKGLLKLDPSRNPDPVTYHDPCNFGRSADIMEEPRELIRACVSDFREMTPNREKNWCCGGGGGLANFDSTEGVKKRDTTFEEYRMKIAGKKKLEQIRATGAGYVAAPCANCKRQIRQLMEYHKTGVEVGGVFDLLNRAIVFDKSSGSQRAVSLAKSGAAAQPETDLTGAEPATATPSVSARVSLVQVNLERADLPDTSLAEDAVTEPELKGVGLCTVHSPQGEWAFDYALSLARRNKVRLNIYQFFESPYTFQRDMVYVDAKKTKIVPVTSELLAEKDKELRFWYDERLEGYVNVGFRFCEGNDDWELTKCFKRGDYDVLVIGYEKRGGGFGATTTLEKFARSFRGAVVLVGPDDPHSFYVNKKAEGMLDRLNIPKDRWQLVDGVG
jgi:Fe-S oxidoreductase